MSEKINNSGDSGKNNQVSQNLGEINNGKSHQNVSRRKIIRNLFVTGASLALGAVAGAGGEAVSNPTPKPSEYAPVFQSDGSMIFRDPKGTQYLVAADGKLSILYPGGNVIAVENQGASVSRNGSLISGERQAPASTATQKIQTPTTTEKAQVSTQAQTHTPTETPKIQATQAPTQVEAQPTTGNIEQILGRLSNELLFDKPITEWVRAYLDIPADPTIPIPEKDRNKLLIKDEKGARLLQTIYTGKGTEQGSTSEGDSYLMEFALLAGDQKLFGDACKFAFNAARMGGKPNAKQRLPGWHMDKDGNTTTDQNPATDAVVNNIGSLIEASKKWGAAEKIEFDGSQLTYQDAAIKLAESLLTLKHEAKEVLKDKDGNILKDQNGNPLTGASHQFLDNGNWGMEGLYADYIRPKVLVKIMALPVDKNKYPNWEKDWGEIVESFYNLLNRSLVTDRNTVIPSQIDPATAESRTPGGKRTDYNARLTMDLIEAHLFDPSDTRPSNILKALYERIKGKYDKNLKEIGIDFDADGHNIKGDYNGTTLTQLVGIIVGSEDPAIIREAYKTVVNFQFAKGDYYNQALLIRFLNMSKQK